MRIFKRIKSIAAAEINGLLDQAEDPIQMLNQYLREMEEEIVKGQAALSQQIYLEKRQLTLILDTEQVIAKRSRQAQLAADRGEEAIAKLALQEKLINEQKCSSYREQNGAIRNQTNLLRGRLNQLKEKYQELNQRRILLLSRANVAQSINQMNQTLLSFNTDNVARGFARAEERVLIMEAEVEAKNYSYQHNGASVACLMDPIMAEEVQKEWEKLKETSKIMV